MSTKENLLNELTKIVNTLNNNGNVAYYEGENGNTITHLCVCTNGCIGAMMYRQTPYYSINSIYIDKNIPIVSSWAVGGTVNGNLDPVKLIDTQDTLGRPFVYAIMDVNSHDMHVAEGYMDDMLETYQKTLDDDDSIAPVAVSNSFRRIGGVNYKG